MGVVGNIVCKTIGIAALSAVTYDAYKCGKAVSKNSSEANQADYFEGITAAERTTTNISPVTNAMQKKVANLRMNNPIISVASKIKGFITGAISSLGDNIIPVTFAAMAIAGKGFFAKLGAWGIAGYSLLTILKEGFGVGKKSPID